jgi:hypothetical protein
MKIRYALPLVALLLAGCGKFGTGETVGYVYAVDDGIFWDKVWFKTSLESSESDCYLIDDNNLKSQLQEAITTNKVKLTYAKHFFTLADCPNDEITSFEIIE